jgi:hypothetical protein
MLPNTTTIRPVARGHPVRPAKMDEKAKAWRHICDEDASHSASRVAWTD